MLWFFVALQAMTPFIHAHADTVQPGSGYAGHAGSLHVRQCAHGDAACHAIAADEHDAEIEVAQGMPLRNDTPGMVVEVPLAASLTLPPADVTERPGAGLPAPPPLHLALPDHTLPHALAPPLA
jgi:hypothetical protein